MNKLKDTKMNIAIPIDTIKRIKFLLLISIISVCITSCSSRDEEVNTGNGVTPEGTVLTVSIDGIATEGDITSLANASINTKGINASPSMITLAKEKVVSAGGFDALVSAEGQINTENRPTTTASISYTGAIAAVSKVPVNTGTQYRILIYDETGTQLVSNTQASSGTNPNIKVDAGKKYKWYAFSINESSVPNINAQGVISGSSLSNKDVLYSQGIIDAQYGQNYLNVVFKRNTARIALDLDTRGMFGTINNTTSVELGTGTGSGFTSIIQTGDLNVFTGLYSNLQNVSPVTGSSMTNKAGVGGAAGATKTAVFYTVRTANVPVNNLRIRLNQLDITMDNSSTRSFSNSIIPYNNTVITPVLGNNYSLNARLIESGIRVKGLLWARTNLLYSSQSDAYRFRVDNEYSQPDKDTEYWNWMSATPTGSSSDNVDPCTRVYPQGEWRMPTSAEFSNLGQPNDKNERYGLFLGASFSAVYNLDAGNSPNTSYPQYSQNLFLSFYGYRSTSWLGGTSISDSPGGIFLGALGSGSAYYWSSTDAGSGNANYWYMNYSRFAWFVGWSNAEIRSGAKSDGRMVRCVRSVTTPNT
ncbi:hypothetical protein [Elizabethkingia meningoseptica]|uniref:hypothetical protein n=1 Tax=Elizabethkingia meningoseptica TaxID=238 RepID=UPI001116EC26|nr:hypothetical protein [Elizabethkingia meningoseptica]